MSTQEKSKALATLMHWNLHKITEGADWFYLKVELNGDLPTLEPYEDSPDGLAQFAAILLKFPEVMERFNSVGSLFTGVKPTQKGILDEILRMKGELK